MTADAANDCRMRVFHEGGWPLARFHAERLGPVLLSECVSCRRELRLGDTAHGALVDDNSVEPATTPIPPPCGPRSAPPFELGIAHLDAGIDIWQESRLA